jgi:hypothetical protein
MDNDLPTQDAMCEVTWVEDGRLLRSNTATFTIEAPVGGDSPIPIPEIPPYPLPSEIVSKSYVDAGDAALQAQVNVIAPQHEEIVSEIPIGAVDGVNSAFNTRNDFVAGSVAVYINGLRQSPSYYWLYPPTTIQFITSPNSGDVVTVDYVH